jgi:hypothetical protein
LHGDVVGRYERPAPHGLPDTQLVSVSTELRLVGDRAQFRVQTADPAYRRALAELMFTDDGDAFVRTYPADARRLHESYLRFKLSLEDLLAQTAGRRLPPWEEALDAVATRLQVVRVPWFLTGSAALAVRGVDVVPRDLDLVVADSSGAGLALADVQIEPVTENRPGSWIARWFGRAFLHARVEWVADVDPAIDVYSSPNELGPRAAARLETVRWLDHELSLVPLDVQLAVTERRGLAARAETIRDFLG